MIVAGIDIGSRAAKSVVMNDGSILSSIICDTGPESVKTAYMTIEKVLESPRLSLDDVQYIVATGYGRVLVPFANENISEISCHARGINWYFPSVRTILDMGGQDCKVIRCDERGKVSAFVMNDKCAAGTGRGMEVFADLLAIPIEEVGELSLQVDEEPPPVSCTCVVFAKSEATALLRQGWAKSKVLAAYCSAMAHRVVTLLEQVGIEKDFAITGGIAKNIGVVKRLEDEIDAINGELNPLRSFVLPGGSAAAAALHVARTVCRRAERIMVELAAQPGESV